MNHHEHHFRNLGRARDHLSETIMSLRSAVDLMTGDDWIDATAPAVAAPPLDPALVGDVPELDAPNAKRGAALVAKHGGIDAAMMAYEPDSREFDDIQAYRYVTSGRRPKGWIPPIV